MQSTGPATSGGLTSNQKLAAGAAALGLGYWYYSRRQACGVPAIAVQGSEGAGVVPEGVGCSCARVLTPAPLLALLLTSQAKNVGDTVSRTGSQALKEEGRGLQAKQH